MFRTILAVIVLLISLATTTAVMASDRCEELRELQVHFDALSPEQQEHYNTVPGAAPSIADPWGASGGEQTEVDQYRNIRWQIFTGWATNSTALTMDQLNTAANELECLGNYRPMARCHMVGKTGRGTRGLRLGCTSATRLSVKNTTAAELITAYDGRKVRLAAKLKCDADPKCVAERDKANLLGSLCFDIEALRETKARLLQRRKDEVEYGIINSVEHNDVEYDDIETKNHLLQSIQVSKAEFRRLVGRPFKPSDCKGH